MADVLFPLWDFLKVLYSSEMSHSNNSVDQSHLTKTCSEQPPEHRTGLGTFVLVDLFRSSAKLFSRVLLCSLFFPQVP